jgi:hypothetical protein
MNRGESAKSHQKRQKSSDATAKRGGENDLEGEPDKAAQPYAEKVKKNTLIGTGGGADNRNFSEGRTSAA